MSAADVLDMKRTLQTRREEAQAVSMARKEKMLKVRWRWWCRRALPPQHAHWQGRPGQATPHPPPCVSVVYVVFVCFVCVFVVFVCGRVSVCVRVRPAAWSAAGLPVEHAPVGHAPATTLLVPPP